MAETLQYPLRVRVVNNFEPHPAPRLALGFELVAIGEFGNNGDMYTIHTLGGYLKSRFKPVVRVKMGRAVL